MACETLGDDGAPHPPEKTMKGPRSRGTGGRQAGGQSGERAARYWNDDAYGRFLNVNRVEQNVMLSPASRGFTNAGAQLLDTAWRRRGLQTDIRLTSPGRESNLSGAQLARFQRAFAEVSVGNDQVPSWKVPALLQASGLSLSASAVSELLAQVLAQPESQSRVSNVDHVGSQLSYEAVLMVYSWAVNSPRVVSDTLGNAVNAYVREECGETASLVDTEGLGARFSIASPPPSRGSRNRPGRNLPKPRPLPPDCAVDFAAAAVPPLSSLPEAQKRGAGGVNGRGPMGLKDHPFPSLACPPGAATPRFTAYASGLKALNRGARGRADAARRAWVIDQASPR